MDINHIIAQITTENYREIVALYLDEISLHSVRYGKKLTASKLNIAPNEFYLMLKYYRIAANVYLPNLPINSTISKAVHNAN